MYIYIYICVPTFTIKERKHIYHTWMLYIITAISHWQIWIRPNRTPVLEADFFRIPEPWRLIFTQPLVPPKKQRPPTPREVDPPFPTKVSTRGGMTTKGCVYFFAFFVKLLNQKDTSCCNRSSEIKSKKTLPFRFFSGVGGRSIQIFDFD